MKHRMQLVCLAAMAAGVAGLAACSSQSARVSGDGAGAAGPVSTDAQDYRKIRFAEAMRGLVIEDGLVRPDAAAAQDLLRGLGEADAGAALARGHALMAENDYSGAAGEYRTAILADSSLAAGYIGLGDALLGKKKDDLALAAYRTAVLQAPESVEARMKLAETLNRNGDIAAWAAELENVLALDPAHGEAHARLAVARYYLGDQESARREIRLADRFGGTVPPQLRDMINN